MAKSVEIKAFTGIDQSVGAHNLNMNIAYDAKNCNTEHGVLTPATGFQAVYPTLPGQIVTLCSFYRRNIEVEADRRVLVAATATALYAILENGSAWTTLMTGLQSGEWSWVTYETTRDLNDPATPSNPNDDSTVDILILSNALDGMVVVYGNDLTAEKLAVTKPTIPKFAVLERHAERIWGIGVEGEPDNLYYSQPYKPFEWGYVYDPVDGTTPLGESSGGVIQWPTWDGDKFVAIKRFSNNLLAFKERSAFYVRGLTAGEFAVVEAYGSDGIMAPGTIVTDGAASYYLADGGLGAYDGDTAALLDNDRLFNVFSKIGSCAPETACAIISKHVLYLSLPVYTGATTTTTLNGVSVTTLVEPDRNNLLVEYDTRRKTYMIRTGIQADALHNHGGRLLFTSGNNPYQVYEITGTTYNGAAIPMRWESSWQDLGAKNTLKSEFVIHITGFDSADEQDVTIGIETERKVKSKVITLVPGFSKTRFTLNNTGRKYRFFIEANSTVSWQLAGGVQIEMEVDED